MKRFILFWALLVLIAAPASAVDTNKYPFVIIDADCTDSFDVPAAVTPGLTHFTRFNPTPAVQISGSPDTYCDNDSRIATGAIVADTTFGPFSNIGIKGLYIMTEVTTSSGGDLGWRTFIAAYRTQDMTLLGVEQLATENDASGSYDYTVGASPGSPLDINDGTYDMQLPQTFYFRLDLNTATSWTGSISLIPWGD